MMTKKIDGGIVTYQNSQDTKDAVFEKILAFFMRLECFHGECCHQRDDVQIEVSNLLSELTENIFKFNVNYKDENEDELEYKPVPPNQTHIV